MGPYSRKTTVQTSTSTEET